MGNEVKKEVVLGEVLGPAPARRVRGHADQARGLASSTPTAPRIHVDAVNLAAVAPASSEEVGACPGFWAIAVRLPHLHLQAGGKGGEGSGSPPGSRPCPALSVESVVSPGLQEWAFEGRTSSPTN